MTPVKFPQQNCTVGENQPKYLPLPAFFDGKAMVTAWQMDEQERKEFLRTGRIYLTQLTFGQPFQHVKLSIDCPITSEQNAPNQ